MSTSEERRLDISDMDRYLTNKASAFRYPPTPDIAPAVRRRLVPASAYRDAPAAGRTRKWGGRFAFALAAVGVALALVVTVPGLRALVGDLYAGVVRIAQGEPPWSNPVPNVPLTPTATPRPRWDPRVAGETDLGTALRSAGTPLKLPSYPEGLGLPDRVYYQPAPYGLVLYAWLDPADSARPRMTLFQMPSRLFSDKVIPASTEVVSTRVKVEGFSGLWVQAGYNFKVSRYDHDGRLYTSDDRLTTSEALVWSDPETELTYKLAGSLSLDEAVKVATSMRLVSPLPTPEPTRTAISPASRMDDLIGETFLYNAVVEGFRIQLPILDDMPELVDPNRVFVQEIDGKGAVVILAWYTLGRNDDLRIVLTQGQWDTSDAGGVEVVQETTVAGNPARWVRGQQTVYVEGSGGEPAPDKRSFIKGAHALVWQSDGLYYRLETTLSLAEAVRIAEAMR